MGSIDIYEIKDNELDIFEKGESTAVQLNFAVFLLSLGFNGVATLSTATFESDLIQIFFVVATVIGFLGGFYLLFQWRQSKTSIKELARGIRGRMPTPADGQEIGDPPVPTPPLEPKAEE